MKTRILLHGGYLHAASQSNDEYFTELTRGLQDGDKVLFIGFARTDNRELVDTYNAEKQLILDQTDKKIKVINANRDDLTKQIQGCEAIQITGGSIQALLEVIKEYPEFLDSIRGKTIGGSSAGAMLFSRFAFHSSTESIIEGLSLIPVKLMVHYGNLDFKGTDKFFKLLSDYDNKTELVALKETEWKEYQVDI